MKRMIALLVAALLLVGGCGSDSLDDPLEDSSSVTVISPSTAREVIADDAAVVLDVRTRSEYQDSHVVGAININVQADDFVERLGDLEPSDTYLVYCRSGSRSAAAAQIMADEGFGDVLDAGGLQDLADAGVPVE